MSIPPADPLGTVAQDPEAVRTAACKLVANDATCTTVTLRPSDPGRTTSAAAAGLDVVTMLLWSALIVGLVLVLVIVARAMARRSSRGRHDEDEDEDVVDETADELGAVIVDRRREPLNWRREAEEHRRAGRYRDAVRCRYRALVADLARRGLIDEIPGRTTGEERTQLHDVAPMAGRPFDRAADLFDSAWYGNAAIDADDDDVFIELEREVLAIGTRGPG